MANGHWSRMVSKGGTKKRMLKRPVGKFWPFYSSMMSPPVPDPTNSHRFGTIWTPPPLPSIDFRYNPSSSPQPIFDHPSVDLPGIIYECLIHIFTGRVAKYHLRLPYCTFGLNEFVFYAILTPTLNQKSVTHSDSPEQPFRR